MVALSTRYEGNTPIEALREARDEAVTDNPSSLVHPRAPLHTSVP